MPLTMPSTPGFKRSRFGLRTNTQQGLTSPLTRSTQVLLLPGAQWVASYTLPPMRRATAAPWLAFLAQLDGMAETFWGFDPDAIAPQGTGAGAPKVNGGGQTGAALVTDGWTALSAILKAGDYVAFDVAGGRSLHMVTADVSASAGGAATLAIKPNLRASPADNADIYVTVAAGLGVPMGLVDDGQMSWDADELGLFSITFNAQERF